jgi:hypothetical protein
MLDLIIKIDAPPPKTAAIIAIVIHQFVILALVSAITSLGGPPLCFKTSTSVHLSRLIPKRIHSLAKFTGLLLVCAAAEIFIGIKETAIKMAIMPVQMIITDLELDL